MAELEPNEAALFRTLVERTKVLAVVCDNAAVVLSEQFADMVTGPLASVQEVLARCPDYARGSGPSSARATAVEESRHDSQRDGPPRGIRIRHLPTDLSVESYTKQTRMENELVARRALSDLVQRRWEREQEAEKRRTARKSRK